MGRAIVREPKAFLMDEPLSNLDAKLRVTIRAQLSALHQRLQATTVYVTHDQVEAMTLGHRVAVMRDGRILQIGTPQDLYQRPETLYVAAFIGSPAMNLVEADVADGVLSLGEARIALAGRLPADGRVIVGIRPEAFEDASLAERALPELEVAVDVVEEIGPDTHVIFPLDATPVDAGEVREATGEDDALIHEDRVRITARLDPRTRARVGSRLRVCVDPSQFHFFDVATGRRLVAEDALVTSPSR
jgi:multiple sugar transport system ATP-binding protein